MNYYFWITLSFLDLEYDQFHNFLFLEIKNNDVEAHEWARIYLESSLFYSKI